MASRGAIAILREQGLVRIAAHSKALGERYGVAPFAPPQPTRDIEYNQAAFIDALGTWLGEVVDAAQKPPEVIIDESLTVAQLKAYADGHNIPYAKDVTKAELIAAIRAEG